MFNKIKIKNYRCFENCEIEFKDLSILVGRNNAGKSTLIEALRIVSIAVNRAPFLNYSPTPYWLDIDKELLGINPSIDNLDISINNIFYLYGEAPAIISVYFENGTTVDTYIGEEVKIFSVIFDKNGKNIVSKKMARDINMKQINILPQISPLLREEQIVKYSTVQRNVDTRLGSRNFRNQLKYFYDDYFEKFKLISESTWTGLGIRSLENRTQFEGQLLLMIRDSSFIAEVGWMGHGLQMWLQTMWFIARCDSESTIILDEPDVYMHADLQRRLIRYINGKYRQIIIATHSVEIMAEVEAENILPVDSSKAKLGYANKAPILQEIIDEIGSVHNLEIARLFAHKKFLIVEGDYDDIKILSILQGIISRDTLEPFDILPKTFVEGWGGWQRIIGSNKVFVDNKTEIKTYCILDSDYHTREEIQSRKEEAQRIGLNLHVWSKKEIENFLLVPSVICRVIKNEMKTPIDIDDEMVKAKLSLICEDLKEEVIDDFATEFHSKNKGQAVKTVNQKAREYVNTVWQTDSLCLIPGKRAISRLSEWSNAEFHVNLNPFKIAREFKLHEINHEISELIETIEKGR